jgi:hypothetical protein
VRRFLFDLNVVLDVLFERKAHVAEASALWRRAREGVVQGLLPAHGFTTLHCLARHEKGAAFAGQAVDDLLTIFGVAPVDESVIRRAVRLGWTDFENAVCAAAAEAASCEAIVSRDPAGFSKCPITVLTPKAALALIATDPKG